MVSLNEKRLTATGINQAVNEIQEAAQRNAFKAGKSVEVLVSERLDADKDLLKRIYFLNMNEEQIQGEIQSARFAEFPQLQYVLGCIFAQEKHPGVIPIPEGLPDWTPPHTYTKKSLQDLISKYRYFDNTSEAMGFFETLQPLCRKMTQLVERQADDEEMAYKLMVLFPQRDEFSDHTGCLNAISGKFNSISKPVQAQKPYHWVFVTELGNFPIFETQEKINAWRAFIVKEKFEALAFFADCNSFESVPETIKAAKSTQLKNKYPRALENPEFAAFCKSLLIKNDGFESGLDFIKAGWPKKKSDNLPLVDIKVSDETYEYRWVKLPQKDKRALYLGNMTSCCQFINGHSRQCVIDGISLSDNGFYVLLKKRTPQQKSKKDETSDSLDGDIVAMSYAWISSNGNLCLDSLEWNKERIEEATLKTLMTTFADQVVQKYPQVKYVNVGAGGQTPKIFGKSVQIRETQRQGLEYGDAAVQYCIQSRLNPEVTEMLDKLQSFNELDKTIQGKIGYLSAYFAPNDLSAETIPGMSELLKSSFFQPFPPINQPLTELDFTPLTIEQYLGLPENERQGISTFCKLLNCDSLDTFVKWLSEIPCQERINILISRDNFGKTVIHTAAGNSDSLKTILQLLRPEERLEAVKAADKDGQTVLQTAEQKVYPFSLKEILECLSSADRLEAVKAIGRYGLTVLHTAAQKVSPFSLNTDFHRPFKPNNLPLTKFEHLQSA